MTWIALVLVFVFALLFVPWTVHLAFHRHRPARVSADLSWGGLRLGGLGTDAEGRERPAATREVTRSGRKRGAFRLRTRQVLALVRSEGFVASLVRLGRQLLRQLRPRNTDLFISFGLGDPADTGVLFGALSPLVVMLMTLDSGVMLAPDFSRRSFDVEGETSVRIVPGVLILLLLGYLARIEPWRAAIRSLRA